MRIHAMSLPIITIARQFGSGGRIVGEKVSTLLNIPLYDRKLVEFTAEKSGFCAAVVEQMSQKKPASLLYALSGASIEFPLQDQVYFAQAKVIREIGEQGASVIVGRCADSILEEKRLLRVFLYASDEARIKRTKEEYKIEAKNYADFIRKKDKKRKGYYDYFTHRSWGKSENYDLCINTDIGLDLVADIIARTAREMEF